MFKRFAFVSTFLTTIHLVATPTPGFITAPYFSSPGQIYSFDPLDLSTPPTSIISGINQSDCLAFSPDATTVYFTSFTENDVYSFPSEGPYTATALGTGISFPGGLAISSDGTTGYVATDDGTPGIYSFPLGGSAPHTATLMTSTGASIAAPLIITITGATAYVGDFINGGLYKFPVDSTTTYNATQIQSTMAIPSVSGLAISSDGFLYISTGFTQTIYRVPLTNPTATPTLVATGSFQVDGVTVSEDGTTLFVASIDGGGVFAVPTTMGFPQTLSSVALTLSEPIGVGVFSVYIPSNIITSGLSGNNLTFANYLNANAPADILVNFSSLTGAALNAALESMAPTRNAFATYASQNGYLAASQVLCDHDRQKRFHQQPASETQMALANGSTDGLLVDSRDEVYVEPNAKVCSKRDPYTVWATPFGEYAREKAQHETPAFSLGVGGAVAAFEYNGTCGNVVGFGGAYAYTHVHEEQGMGHASVNQGYLTLYTTLNASKCYFDLAVWGGYYQSGNTRNISFSEVDETAKSNTHGWQFAPHLEIGYDGFRREGCGVKWFGVEPFVMGDWVANWEHGFKEHGAPGYNMEQNGRFCSFFRGESGLRFHEIAQFNWGRLIFREKGSYVYQKAFNTGRITASLIGSGGSFTVDTLTSAQNLGVAEFSMLFVSAHSNAPYVDIRYQGEFGSQYQSHQGMLEIGKNF